MKKILIATSNQHKVEEFRHILKDSDIELISLKELDDHNEVVEDGKTFQENSYLKAKFYHDLYHLPTMADDSGISISYLNNYPNIHSSRFMEHLGEKRRNQLITEIMKDVTDRRAFFTTVITYIDDEKTLTFEGIYSGEIAQKPEGEGGFGYDPIFYVKEMGKTMGVLGNAYKDQHSHRAIALRKVREYFESNS